MPATGNQRRTGEGAAGGAGRSGITPRAVAQERGKGRRVEDLDADDVLRRGAFRLRLGEVDLEVGRHLVRHRIRNAETLPLAAALLDERVHAATSASTGPSTASSASRAARHSATPVASARRPSGEGR